LLQFQVLIFIEPLSEQLKIDKQQAERKKKQGNKQLRVRVTPSLAQRNPQLLWEHTIDRRIGE
jgi:hypothetical protein